MLPRAAVDCLIEYKAWQETARAAFADEYRGTPRLFTQEYGASMYPDTPSQWLRKFLKRNALPPLPFLGFYRLCAACNAGMMARKRRRSP